MPLLINDLVYDETNFTNFYQFYSTLKETSINQFGSKDIRLINSPKFLYINQSEYCIVDKNDDNIDYVGSDESTTCCLLFLEDERSIAVAHLDNGITFEQLEELVDNLIANSTRNQQDRLDKQTSEPRRLDCRLVGSYCDENEISFELIFDLLNFLNDIQNVQINLKIAYFLELNTKFANQNPNQSSSSNQTQNSSSNQIQIQSSTNSNETSSTFNRPVFYGAAYNLQTAEFCPAKFVDRSPLIIQRKARSSSSRGISQVYNSRTKLFVIDAFRYQNRFKNIDLLINANDRFILEHFSTSSNCEPDHFVDDFRQVYRLIKANQSKIIEPKIELKRQSDGSWLPV